MPTVKVKNANGEWESVAAVNGTVIVEPIELSGNQAYGCAGDVASKYIELFGDKITTKGITSATYMFNNYKNTTIPFDINLQNNVGNMYVPISYMFLDCKNLKKAPKISGIVGGMNYLFQGCESLVEIPNDIFENLRIKTTIGHQSMFRSCKRLREIPVSIFNIFTTVLNADNCYFHNGFNECYILDELRELPIPYSIEFTSNAFGTTFKNCARLKEITFATEDNQPKIMSWTNQNIDLSIYTGYGRRNYYSIITTEGKEVVDAATYEALKNDPDYYTYEEAYSRYNHDSAVATINSLPDTSDYLASAGGTNTIKFKGTAGSATDGGAINTLTEEEIAVAAAKGWTVSLI